MYARPSVYDVVNSVNPCQNMFEQSTEIETFIDWLKSGLSANKVNEPYSTYSSYQFSIKMLPNYSTD